MDLDYAAPAAARTRAAAITETTALDIRLKTADKQVVTADTLEIASTVGVIEALTQAVTRATEAVYGPRHLW